MRNAILILMIVIMATVAYAEIPIVNVGSNTQNNYLFINQSLTNVNNSDLLDGFDSTYFYPASNPDGFISSYVETDPVWTADKPNYITSGETAGILQGNLSGYATNNNLNYNISNLTLLYYPLNSNPYNYSNTTVDLSSYSTHTLVLNNKTYIIAYVDSIGNWSNDKSTYDTNNSQQLSLIEAIESRRNTNETYNQNNHTALYQNDSRLQDDINSRGNWSQASSQYYVKTQVDAFINGNETEVNTRIDGNVTLLNNQIIDNQTFIKSTSGNTLGAIVNKWTNHTSNPNNIIFAVVSNGTSGVMMPHFWVQNGAGSQASGISRSFMIVNENYLQQNTTNITSCISYANYSGDPLKIDCNTTTTGADLLVGDDVQIMGDVWLKDDHSEYHFLSNDLTHSDDMMSETSLDATRAYTTVVGGVVNFTLESSNGNNLEVNFGSVIYDLGVRQINLTLTSGTNTTPVNNYIHFKMVGSTPVLTTTTTYPSYDHIDIANYVIGSASGDYANVYAYSRNRYEVTKFIQRVLERFEKQGVLYLEGFDTFSNTTQINISVGELMQGIFEFTTANTARLQSGFYFINSSGNFVQGTSLADFTQYSDGTAFAGGANERVNIVWGIVITNTSLGGTTTVNQRLVAVLPSNQGGGNYYSSVSTAIQDNFGTLNYFPPDDAVKRSFLPIARTILRPSTDLFEPFVGTTYHRFIAGTTSTGGASPTPGTTDHSLLSNLDYASSGHTGFASETALNTNITSVRSEIVGNATLKANVTDLTAETNQRIGNDSLKANVTDLTTENNLRIGNDSLKANVTDITVTSATLAGNLSLYQTLTNTTSVLLAYQTLTNTSSYVSSALLPYQTLANSSSVFETIANAQQKTNTTWVQQYTGWVNNSGNLKTRLADGKVIALENLSGSSRVTLLTDVDGGVLYLYNSSGQQWINFNPTSNSYISQPTKNFGIGTTTPTNKFNVVGDANITGTLYANWNGSSIYQTLSNSSSVFETIANAQQKTNTSYVNQYTGWINSTSTNTVLSVGIGTTTIAANAKVNVSGNITFANSYDCTIYQTGAKICANSTALQLFAP